ncbi:MAG: 4Fe-4S dicluster domain-containing protein [Solirubrobacterales bacterium]
MSEAVFIDVEISDEVAGDAELAKKLDEVCPVDIFTSADDTPETVPENLDECVLCELCIEAAPPGAVVVKKLYDGTELRR